MVRGSESQARKLCAGGHTPPGLELTVSHAEARDPRRWGGGPGLTEGDAVDGAGTPRKVAFPVTAEVKP